ncbi:MAG TPA: universal stress protein [Candidatus Dormibacteraeota bacterium]|nr:universal stress protein [Candidatus Dormibacteraeota bacterium]
MADEIVLGFDGSEGSRTALEETIALATGLGTGVVVAFGYATNPLGGENRDEELAIRELGGRVAEEAAADIRAAGVVVAVELVHDRPAEAILEVARAHGARLIVVGSRSENPIVGAILGSVAYKLVHRSPVPVLVVPPRE